MQYKISDEARENATKCPSKMNCIYGGGGPKCEVERGVENSGVFLQTVNDGPCPYKMSFGYDFICNCPVRIELYTRHGV